MRQPTGKGDANLGVCIPCRNEAKNIGRLVAALKAADPTVPIYVFDDESTDETANLAESAGAVVIRPPGELPEGWTGKNRACHTLGHYAQEDWIVFLDADVYPQAGFYEGIRALIASRPKGVELITGFPHIISGRGAEPLFLGWVGWILLATNPFGLVSATGKGHNRFTNGQIQVWNRATYLELKPNEQVRSRILEDVMIGRLCAKNKIGILTANLSKIMAVKMYDTWQETLDGMSKNSYEIMGSVVGNLLVAALLLVLSWGWLLAPWMFGLFLLSGIACALIVRKNPLATVLLPIALTLGAFTIVRSIVWHKTGRVTWKGRVYKT